MLNWFLLSLNLNIFEIISNPHLPWSRSGLSHNRGITISIIMNTGFTNLSGNWDWKCLSKNQPLAVIISLFNTYPWCIRELSKRTDINSQLFQLLLANVNEIDWYAISKNLDMETILDHPHLPWDLIGLSNNKDITLEIVDSVSFPNATNNWNWFSLSQTIPISDILNNLNRNWNMNGLCSHPQLLVSHLDKI